MNNILLVDDSKAVHSLVAEMLDGAGFVLQHAYNGAEAVNLVGAGAVRASMILLDWEMPELTGIEALPQLRKLLPSLPIVMMTSKNTMSNIVEALECGATDYIMKPFTRDILVGKITQILGLKVS